jgi:hypothetical protein
MKTAQEAQGLRINGKSTLSRTPSTFCALLCRLFERHGQAGTGTLDKIRPWGGRAFRDGLTEYRIVRSGVPICISMLWYEESCGAGYTSRAVRMREVIR